MPATLRREGLQRAAMRRKPRRSTGPSLEVRRLVYERDGGRCVACGARTEQIQHRVARGMGGRRSVEADAWVNSPASLVLLCGSGTTGCHGWVEAHPAVAVGLGFRVSTNGSQRPDEVPVLTRLGWVELDIAGGARLRPGLEIPFPNPLTSR
jgi:hypothetical protein